MTTEDYRGCTQTTHSGNSPSANDKNSAGCFPGPSDGTQIRKTFGQEGSGRFFCVAGS